MTVKETSSKISQYGEHKNLIGLFLNSKVDKKMTQVASEQQESPVRYVFE